MQENGSASSVDGADPTHGVSTGEVGGDDEVARLEALLFVRTRERRELEAEVARRTTLLRDAMARFADLPREVQEPAAQPASSNFEVEAMVHFTAQRDAAVARALDAEAGRAEAIFRLDEALGHLRVAQQAVEQQAELHGTVRGLRLRASELEEAWDMSEARLLLAEQDLQDARAKIAQERRQREELIEQYELSTLQARSTQSAIAQELSSLKTGFSAATGQCQGLAARALESEQAWAGMRTRAQRAEHAAEDAQDKLALARTDAAERQVENHAAAQRERELHAQLAAVDHVRRGLQREVEHLSSELAALREGAVREVRDVAQAAEASQATLKAVRASAVELGAAVAEVVAGMRAPVGVPQPEVSEELTSPGTALGFEAVEALEHKLRASDERIQELEATIAGRMSRDVGVTTLKGELVDVRAAAARLSDDINKERTRRRKIGVTVRALQAASESGESIVPWVEELLSILAEGASVPPPRY